MIQVGKGDRSGKRAVDGDLDTRWEFKLNRLDANTFTIPLSNDEDVDTIHISERLWGSETTRISKIKVEAIKGQTSSVILAETTYAPDQTPSGNPRFGTKKITFENVKADELKITLTPKKAGVDDLVNISEIALYGTKAEGDVTPPVEENYTVVAQDTMRVFASDEHPNVGAEGLASFAIDGSESTWWHTSYANKKELPQSITLDLKDVKTIGKYVYTPRNSGTNGIITSYELQTSIDNITYHKVAEGSWANNATKKTILFDAENARYVRLIAKAGVGGFASAAELNVYEIEKMTKVGLQKTIDAVEALNLSNYIESSKAHLAKAKEDAKAAIANNASDTELFEANKKLVEALNKLLLIGDRNALVELYESKKDMKAEDYVKHGFDQFLTVMNDIKAMIDNEKELSQKEIDTISAKLAETEKNLISIVKLKAFVSDAMNVSIADCSEESGQVFATALANARLAMEDKDASLFDITKAQYDLEDAKSELKADATALHTMILGYEQDKNMYTTKSWEAFQSALDKAKEVSEKADPTIEELFNARGQLQQKATEILVEKVDTDFSKELLKKIIDEVELAKANGELDKLAPSVQALITSRLAEANEVYKDEEATNDNVIQAWMNLVDIMHYFDFIADKAELKQLIDICEKIDLKDYQVGVEEFSNALANAIAVYKDNGVLQDTINKAFQRLQSAKNGLGKHVADKSILSKLVNEIVKEVGDGSAYLHNEKWDNFQKALANAQKILAKEDVTQADINRVIIELTDTYKDIRLLPNEEMLKELESFITIVDALDPQLYSAQDYAYIQQIRTKVATLLVNFDEEAFKGLQEEMKKVYQIIVNDVIKDDATTDDDAKTEDEEIKKPTQDIPTRDETNLAQLSFVILLSGGILVMLFRKQKSSK